MRRCPRRSPNQPPARGDRHQPAAGQCAGGGDVERAAADRRPAVVRVRAAEGQLAAAGKRQGIAADDVPGEVVVEPEDDATVNVGMGYSEYWFVTIAPAEPLRLPTVCGTPAMSKTPLEAMVRAVASGRLLPLPSSSSVPAEIFVGPLYVLVPLRSSTPAPILVKATVPLVFWITPPKAPLAPLAPTESVQKPPPRLSTVPAPESAPRWRCCR